MINTLLFVHGTGVRKASYEASAARIVKALKSAAPHVTVEPCLWGDDCGARLRGNGVSIPEFTNAQQRQAGPDVQLALWELLALDPLFELRELAGRTPTGLAPPASGERKQRLLQMLDGMGTDPAILARLSSEGYHLDLAWQAAVAAISSARALKDALNATHEVNVTVRAGIARAVVAHLQHVLADDALPPLPVRLRDELVDLSIDALGGFEGGATWDWVSSRLVGLGLRWATAKARRQRDALFSVAAPTAGDTVMYQARGGPIRDFIEQRIRACPGDVAILAHSLGGIACVDLLIEKSLPQVKHLITAGSQAPFLYEINALSSLAYGAPLPDHFPASWQNFYDCNDLLSYKAGGLFTRAVDHEITSGQPFPQAHGAYWDAPALWEKIGPLLN